jgi:hypothetical protein
VGKYEAFVDEVTLELVVPAVVCRFFSLTKSPTQMWRSWVASARAEDVVVLPVPGAPVTSMLGCLLPLTLPFCAMEPLLSLLLLLCLITNLPGFYGSGFSAAC